MIKLQKPVCPVCGSPAFYTLDTVQALQTIDEVTNTTFRYMKSVAPEVILDTRITQRNKNGTITVLCQEQHRWETGMQEITDRQKGLTTEQFGKVILPDLAITDGEDTPEIHKLMVLSTAHITLGTDALFNELMGEDTDRELASGAYLEKTSYGWLIIITGEDDPGHENPYRHYECIPAIVAYARKHGCTHLRIDRDGPTVKDLPTYNW